MLSSATILVGKREISIQVAVGLAIFISAALVQGYDFSWDTLDYHFYNGFAVVNGKVWSNIQVAMHQTYFNPLLDIPFYLLVVTMPPTMVAAILAGVQSLLYVLLFLLGCTVLAPMFRSRRNLFALATFLALIGVAAPVNILEVGTAYGDNTTAVAVMASLFLIVRGIDRRIFPDYIWYSVAAGALVGFATGLKLTNAPFAIALIIVLASRVVLDRSPDGVRIALYSTLAGGCTMTGVFLLLYGWWAMELLTHFGNPLFPSFNNVFRSQYAAYSAYTSPAFALPTLSEKLSFPFTRISVFGPLNFAGLFDLRMTVSLPLTLLGVLTTAMHFKSRGGSVTPNREVAFALLIFFLVSYLCWLFVFPVNRYIVVLEMLAPIICATSIAYLIPRLPIVWMTSVVLGVIWPASALVGWPLMWRPADHRFADGNGYFGLSLPADLVEQGSLVVLLGDKPTTFVVPFFPHYTDFVRLHGSLFYEVPGFAGLYTSSDPQLRHRVFGNALGRAICERVRAQHHKLYALRSSSNDPVDFAALTYYGVAVTSPCRPIKNKSDLTMELCPATRLPKAECERPYDVDPN
jgi:hypothetical protein